MSPTKHMKCFVLYVNVLLGLASVALCLGWTPETIPNPWELPEACGRAVSSWVCDPDRVMTQSDQDLVEGLIKKISLGSEPYKSLQCGSVRKAGAEVAVAVVRNMQASYVARHGRDAAAQDFAKKVHDKWAVGSRDCNNGVVLFVSTEDRRVFISTGAGVRKVLPDSSLDIVIERMKPLLREKRYGEAVAKAVDLIGSGIAGHGPAARSIGDWIPIALVASVVGGLALYSARQSRIKAKEFADTKIHLNKIKESQERAARGQYIATSCPVCLEDFEPMPDMDPAPATEAGGEATQPSTNLRSRNGGIPSPPASESDPLMADSPSSEARQERGKGKAEQAGADAEDKPSSRAMEPVALPCGHVFCEKCIDNWMKSNRSCPICRRDPTRPDDADGGDDKGGGGGGGNGCRDAGDSQGASSSRHSSTWRRPYRGWRMGSGIEAELAYRLMRLQRRYPSYVTHDMLDRWSMDLQHGRPISWANDSAFLMRDPARIEQTRSLGSSGASRSFGGGSSRGGGGRGGGW